MHNDTTMICGWVVVGCWVCDGCVYACVLLLLLQFVCCDIVCGVCVLIVDVLLLTLLVNLNVGVGGHCV